MSTPRLFVNETLRANSDLTLDGEAARYVGRVLRARPEDALVLFDGSGCEYPALVREITRNAVSVRVGAAVTRDVESPLGVRLLQGISRGDRMDTVVQKATELGVRRITPLFTRYSVVQLDAARAAKRREHWQRIGTSACEQCGRNVPPQVDIPQSLESFLAGAAPHRATRLLLQPAATSGFADIATRPQEIELLIGPEGGISADEARLAHEHGFVAVSLGPRVLRTETAAIAALTVVQSLWGDLAAPG